jgi:hypothetical protein
VHAVAAHALRGARVASAEHDPVPALTVLLELIDRQRRIEASHEGAVGMAAPAEVRNPGAVVAAALGILWPRRHVIVAHRIVGIAAMASGAGETPPEVRVLDDRPERHVRGHAGRRRIGREQRIARVHLRIAVAEEAPVAERQLERGRLHAERENGGQVRAAGDHLAGDGLFDEPAGARRQRVEVGARRRCHERLLVVARGREQRRERGRRPCGALRRRGRHGGKGAAEAGDERGARREAAWHAHDPVPAGRALRPATRPRSRSVPAAASATVPAAR